MKLNRKNLLAELKKIKTKGKTDITSKEDNNIKSVFVFAKDKKLHFFGTNKGSIINARFKIDIDDDKESSPVLLEDLETFTDMIEEMEGETLAFEFESKSLVFKDDSEVNTIPLATDTKGVVELLDWYNSFSSDDAVSFKVGDKVGNYTKWFSADAKEIKNCTNKGIKTIGVDNIIFETTDKLSITSDNKKLTKSNSKSIKAEVFDKKIFTLNYIYPIMNSASGNVVFWYYVTLDGKIRLWIKNGAMEWNVKIKEVDVDNGESGENTES